VARTFALTFLLSAFSYDSRSLRSITYRLSAHRCARSALFNWLYARQVGGTFLLRVEIRTCNVLPEESTRFDSLKA
jgi:hypothetical protein